MQKYWNTVQDEQGRPRYGASVAVKQNGVNSTIYSTSTGTAKTNPLTTDSTRGYFEFFAAAGDYDLVVSGVGFDSYTISSGAEVGLPSADVTFTQSGTGAVSTDLQTRGRLQVFPQDYGGTGEKQPIRISRMGCEFYDDFLRANTSAGSVGTPEMGTTYQLLGVNTAAAATQTNISGCRWISLPGDITYATQTLSGNVTKMGMEVLWETGNAGASPAVAAMLIGATQAAGSLALNLALHLQITRTTWTLQVVVANVFTTIASGVFSPALSLSTPYRFEVTLRGATAEYSFPQAQVGNCANAAFSSQIGKYATWEHYYATSSVSEVLRYNAVWAGAADRPNSTMYEDSTGLTWSQGISFTDVSGNARRFYSGGAGGFVVRNAAGTLDILTLSNAGALKATTSLEATTTVTAAAGSGYYLGAGLFALATGNINRIYAASSGFQIFDSSGANQRFLINDTGQLQINNKLFLATDAAVAQAACGLYAGTGVPSNANGANGDIYFRSDGGAATTIYQRRVGVWVATGA